jgi:hypothetical protein
MKEGQVIVYTNSFRILAELLRELRLAFLTEAGLMEDATLLNPRTGELLGSIAGLINDCENTAKLIDDLKRADLGAFEAFQRAQEKA